ncbi:hypothetical protein PSTG_18089, partial [Puccinia striiformis f. sp. tritici PST-78]
ELQVKISDFRLLRQKPFDYSDFEDCVAGYFEHLPKRPNGRSPNNQDRSTSPVSSSLWRLHSYLDSVGCCHFCKKTCGSEPGACRGQIDKKYTDIPSSFITPPKPTDYKPPKPWGPSPSNAGKATHPPAGRPPFRSSTVAGVEELPGHFTYDSAAVEAVQAVGLEFPEDEDDSNLYPQLSTAAISIYGELDAYNNRVQHSATDNTKPTPENYDPCGLASLELTNNTLDNIINEELELTQADEHRLATDEEYVQSPSSSGLAFHPAQVSVNLRQRLSSGLPIRLLAKRPLYVLGSVQQPQTSNITPIHDPPPLSKKLSLSPSAKK